MTATPPKPPTPPASQPTSQPQPKRAIDLDSIRKQLDQEVNQAVKKLDEAESSGKGFRGRSLARRASPQGKSTLPDPAIKDWEIRQPEIGDPGKAPSDPLDRDRDRVEQPEWNATQEGIGSNPATLRENLLNAHQAANQALENLSMALEGRLSHAFWSSTPPPDITLIPAGPISSINEPVLGPEHPEVGPEDEGLTPLQARARRARELTVSKPPDYAAEIKQDRELHPKKWEKIDEEAKRLEERRGEAPRTSSTAPAPTSPVAPSTGIQGPRTSKEVRG